MENEHVKAIMDELLRHYLDRAPASVIKSIEKVVSDQVLSASESAYMYGYLAGIMARGSSVVDKLVGSVGTPGIKKAWDDYVEEYFSNKLKNNEKHVCEQP